jgi:hypothetical protein
MNHRSFKGFKNTGYEFMTDLLGNGRFYHPRKAFTS